MTVWQMIATTIGILTLLLMFVKTRIDLYDARTEVAALRADHDEANGSARFWRERAEKNETALSDKIKIEKFEDRETLVTLHGVFDIPELNRVMQKTVQVDGNSMVIKGTYRSNTL